MSSYQDEWKDMKDLPEDFQQLIIDIPNGCHKIQREDGVYTIIRDRHYSLHIQIIWPDKGWYVQHRDGHVIR